MSAPAIASTSPLHPVRGELVGMRETARRLGVSVDCIRKWQRRPRGCPIPYRIIGGTYHFDTADIDDYLDRTYVPAAKEGRV
jgi:hypothetical protein